MKSKNFRCDCKEPNHCLFFDKDEDYVYVHIMLNNYLSFFSRLKLSIRYLFKLPMASNDHFDCVLLSKEDIQELKDFLNE